MAPAYDFTTIEPKEVEALLSDYPSVVPPKLSDLDASRYETIPTALASRKDFGDAFLNKSELVTLVDWKLSHGTFRPTLKALVNQNSNETVDITTRDAISTFDATSIDSVKKSLYTLTKLKGIGPATASLVLSVYNPEKAPFFSDELFRWVFWEDGKARGWDRPIKYTLKEYLELFEKLQTRVAKDGMRAVDLEKAAYVLGKSEGKAQSKDAGVAKAVNKQGTSSDAQSTGTGKRKRDAGVQEPAVQPSKKSKDATSGRHKSVKTSKSKETQTAGTRSSTRLRKS